MDNKKNFSILKISNNSEELDKFNINDINIEEITDLLNEYLKIYDTVLDMDFYIDMANKITYMYPVKDIGFYFKILM